jgi:Domain of Unknown Function (DUF349)
MSMSAHPTPASLKPVIRPAISQASQWGRVTEDGTVYLKAPEGEVLVGQYTVGTPQEGLTFYARKFDDLVVEVDILESRLKDSKVSADVAQAAVAKVRDSLATRSFVGDIATLETRCTAIDSLIAQQRETEKARKSALREESRQRREALATEAESLSTSTSWKSTTERFTAIVDEWKALPRGDRSSEQEMWKRLSSARTTFDKSRRAHFHELDAVRKDALSRKRELIASAQAAISTTDPKAGIKKFKDLMAEWKKAPRGSRADEDKLWKRFKAAQDEFFTKLKETEALEDTKLQENVPAKEALLVQAEALLPIEGKDLKAVKRSLREIQVAWDKAGELPKADRARLDGKLKKVEDAIRLEDEKQWTSVNPEVVARAADTAHAFSEGLARYEQELAKARSAGDTAKVAELEASISNLRALLGAVENAAGSTRQ